MDLIYVLTFICVWPI